LWTGGSGPTTHDHVETSVRCYPPQSGDGCRGHRFAPASDTTHEEFRRVTEVTYLGSGWGTMSALRRMRSRDARVIVQVGSALAYRGVPLQGAYSADAPRRKRLLVAAAGSNSSPARSRSTSRRCSGSREGGRSKEERAATSFP